MEIVIPDSRWEPFTALDVMRLLDGAPFTWGLAGGCAIEQFLGISIREHGDIDIAVFRDEQLQVQHWMVGWQLFASDPPGTLRPWKPDEMLPFGIHDIWGHQNGVQAWQLQFLVNEVDGSEWFHRKNPSVRGLRSELLMNYHGTPCVRVDVQLLYKARHHLPKDEQDFQACLPLLSSEARQWLKENLLLMYPEGDPWLASL